MRTIYIIILLLLPVFAFGQADTIRKTDKMAARLNFEAGLSYSMFNTNYKVPVDFKGFEYHNKLGEGYSGFPAIGITCDFKLKHKLWFQTGIQYIGSANQEAMNIGVQSSNYHYRYGIPLNIIWDINKRDDTPFIFGGLWASYLGRSLGGLDRTQVINSQGNTVTFNKYGLDINAGFGKLFYMDGRTYFRMEILYQRSITSLIEKPHKMHLDMLIAKIAFSALIDKRIKDKDTN